MRKPRYELTGTRLNAYKFETRYLDWGNSEDQSEIEYWRDRYQKMTPEELAEAIAAHNLVKARFNYPADYKVPA
jgi:hypothetical protein